MEQHTKKYLEDTFKLAKTITIKSSISALKLNEAIEILHGPGSVDHNDPTTWKYYLNISGEYHPKDKRITITSLDTLEEIEFNKENLKIHTVTAKEYQYGTPYYKALISKYPNYEQLILGILYPVDINTAIAAEDGTILSYPTELIEPQEMTLIHELETWIKRYLSRWDVKGYSLTDELYSPAQHAQLYMHLVPKLLNLRLKRCHTNEVHSYHVRMFLSSHLGIDEYIDYLTLEQKLWLYRNIRYIERNIGKNHIQQYIIDYILAKRNIPADKLLIQQKNITRNELPDYTFKKYPLSIKLNRPEKPWYRLDEVMTKEKQSGPDISGYMIDDWIEYDFDRIDKKIQYTNTDKLPTKIVESDLIDYGDLVPRTYEEVVLDHWAYLSHTKDYTAYVLFKDPNTLDTHILSSRDAFILFLYFLHQWINTPIDTIPDWYYGPVVRTDTTKEELMSMVPAGYNIYPYYIDEILERKPKSLQTHTVSEFESLCKSIYKTHKEEWKSVSNIGGMTRRGVLQNIVNRTYLYGHIRYEEHGKSYNTWMDNRGLLPVYNNDNYNYYLSLVELLKSATNYNIDDKYSLARLQRALIKLTRNLSAYSTQYMYDANYYPVLLLNRKTTTTDQGDVDYTHKQQINNSFSIYDSQDRIHDRNILDVIDITTIPYVFTDISTIENIKIDNTIIDSVYYKDRIEYIIHRYYSSRDRIHDRNILDIIDTTTILDVSTDVSSNENIIISEKFTINAHYYDVIRYATDTYYNSEDRIHDKNDVDIIGTKARTLDATYNMNTKSSIQYMQFGLVNMSNTHVNNETDTSIIHGSVSIFDIEGDTDNYTSIPTEDRYALLDIYGGNNTDIGTNTITL